MLARRVRLAVAFGVVALAVPFAAGQPGGGPPDAVVYRDRKKDGALVTARGEAKEFARGVDVLVNGKVAVSIPAPDVVRIDYGKLAGMPDGDRLKSAGIESKDSRDAKDAAAARSAYADMLKAAGADAKTRRFLEFREAMWSARAADTKTDKEFAAEAATAAEKLSLFAKANPKSWEVWPAARTAARLYSELGKPSDAAGMYAFLGKNADLPTDLRIDAQLAQLGILLGGNQLAAQGVLDDLLKDKGVPATGPQREKLTAYQKVLKAPPPKAGAKAAEVVEVEAIIAKATDPGVRSAAHAALGEYYLRYNRPRDAMWEFLWVDTVYNQDRDEVVRVAHRLIEVLAKVGRPEDAEKYKSALPQKRGG